MSQQSEDQATIKNPELARLDVKSTMNDEAYCIVVNVFKQLHCPITLLDLLGLQPPTQHSSS
jgi:hypothetical protein